MVKAPLLMRSQRVLNPQTASLCMSLSVLFFFHTHMYSANTHTHTELQPTHIFLCVLLMVEGIQFTQRVTLWVKGGCRMSRHLGKTYCSLNYYFELVFAKDNRPPLCTAFAELLIGSRLSCLSSYILLVCLVSNDTPGFIDFHSLALIFRSH